MQRPCWQFQHSVFLSFLVAFQLSFFCLSAQAQTSTSATSAATAGAGRASVEATDVHSLNPAILVHLKDRDLHTAYTKDSYVVGITDNSKDILTPAALSFDHSKSGEGYLERTNEDLSLSLAGFMSERSAIGLTGHQIETKTRGLNFRQTNMDVGFTWIPWLNVGFAAVFYNTLKTNQDLPTDLQLQPSIGLGGNFIYRDVMRFRLDVVSDQNDNFGGRSLLLGYESYLNRYILFRLGVGDLKGQDAQIGTIGFGLDLPRFRLNYAFQSTIKGDLENRHSVDLGIPF